MKSVAVYCGSASGKDPAFADAARALGQELVARELTLIYGGGRVGLMGEIAREVLSRGGQAVGVIPTQLLDLEVAHRGLTRLEQVETMAQRKTRMEDLADGFIAMPGGIGTLEELTEVLTMQQLGNIRGPIGLYDVAGFWQPFRALFDSCVQAGFIQQRYLDALIITDDPAEMLDRFETFTPLGAKWEKG